MYAIPPVQRRIKHSRQLTGTTNHNF